MNTKPVHSSFLSQNSVMINVLLFWAGYVAITLSVGFVTSMFISSEVLQITAWGFISSIGLIALSKFFFRTKHKRETKLDLKLNTLGFNDLSIGLLVGAASFGIHVVIVSVFAGPIRFEWVSGIGAVTVLIFFTRFFSTSLMEEIGFRGFTLQNLQHKIGIWPAVLITSIVFGLSHLLYGWNIQTILLGVIPGGLLWGMSAVATRGIAMPIGLHAAWNFAGWTAGNRAEVGLLRMIIEEDALEWTQLVGTISYLSIFGVLTIIFWWIHRKRSESNPAI